MIKLIVRWWCNTFHWKHHHTERRYSPRARRDRCAVCGRRWVWYFGDGCAPGHGYMMPWDPSFDAFYDEWSSIHAEFERN